MPVEWVEAELVKLLTGADPATMATMKRVSAAAMLLVAGKRGRDMKAPEPFVQAGFEPDEEEMKLLVITAEAEGRDLIHISCHPGGSGGPTGMVAVVYFDGGKARTHRRSFLMRRPDSTQVVLVGFSDLEDEICHFVMAPGKKMVRVAGYGNDDIDDIDDFGDDMTRAGEMWLNLATSPELPNCDDEMLGLYSLTRVDQRSFKEAGAKQVKRTKR